MLPMAPSFDPGSVSLRLTIADGRVAAVAVTCRRPVVARVLVGQSAEQAVSLLPLLFSVCGRAQGEAARLALRAARGEAVAPRQDVAVAREIAGEHLWRLLLDWPRALGLPTQEALLAEARRRLAEPDFADWAATRLTPVLDRLVAALAALPMAAASPVPLLPPMTAAQTLAEWPRLDDAFAAGPSWRGGAAETGALARLSGSANPHPLLARIEARRAEVLAPPAEVSAVPVAPSVGRAVVATARGMLMHEISLTGDRVADYVIVAPTEWNCHGRGPLVSWLAGLTGDEARTLAPLALLALDPCVPSRIDLAGGDLS
jgi:hypothetical protein